MNPYGNFSLASTNEFSFTGKSASIKPYLWLLVILLLAYAPLSTFYFGMKNDAFSDNFPNKYFLSEALHSGMLPLWNPYMNFGFPIYADVGFAFWSPVTWLFALIGYNAYTLTVEVLLYIYLAGVFMYRLAVFLKLDQKLALVVAAMYMCSGFFTGCLQYINFLTAAAFLPLLLMAYLTLLQKPGFRKSIILSFAGYMVFAGGHPAIPFAAVYFLAIFSVMFFVLIKSHLANVKTIAKYLLLSIIIFLLIAAPAIYSYSSILDSYSRYSAQQNLPLTDTGFDPLSFLSFLFPMVTLVKQGVFSNDIAMRNAYISLVAVFAIIVSLKTKNRMNLVFLFTGIVMLLFCAGGNFKQSFYSDLPLLNYVRTNGEYRVFTILCFCLSAGVGLQSIIHDEVAKKYLIRLFNYSKILIVILIAFVIIFFSSNLVIYARSLFASSAGAVALLKGFYDTAPFELLLLKNASLAFIFLLLLTFALKQKRYNFFFLLIIADLVLQSILYLPATGIGQVTLRDIHALYNANPQGIVKPALTPINAIDTFDIKTTGLVGDASYYNKKIGTTRMNDYPSFFRNTEDYFNSDTKDTVSKMPYVFLKSQVLEDADFVRISVESFHPTAIKIDVKSTEPDTLILLQNNYKYWKAFVAGKPATIIPIYKTFMGVAVNSGHNEIEFRYQDPLPGWLLLISGIVVMGAVFYLARSKKFS